jgi:hypothetical protein
VLLFLFSLLFCHFHSLLLSPTNHIPYNLSSAFNTTAFIFSLSIVFAELLAEGTWIFLYK